MRLCGECKPAAIRDARRRTSRRDGAAHEALIVSIVGLTPCLLPVLQPVALVKGIVALFGYGCDPTLPNRWKAQVAVGLSGGSLLVVLVIVIALVVSR
jgi:hypothetical protein